MYIISKNSEKDYYDGVAQTTGIDKTIIYKRDFLEFDEKNLPKLFKNSYFTIGNKNENKFYRIGNHRLTKEAQKKYFDYGYFIVGFCGKLYVGWKLYEEKEHKFDNEIITTITYDFDLMKSFLEKKSHIGNIEDQVKFIKNFNSLDFFREYNSPCFIFDGDWNRNRPKLFINPILKNYEFFKIFDSFQAFQEIQMFISGVLGNKEKEIILVEDKYKIQQHGFDKWSFRNPDPPKRKQKIK